MSEDRYLELAPLAALGALDGEDLTGFDAHVPTCTACRSELSSYRDIVARIPLALTPLPPRAALGRQILEQAQPERASTVVRVASRRLFPALVSAAAALLAVGLVVARGERNAAQREAAEARGSAAVLQAELQRLLTELTSARTLLAEQQELRDLVAHPDARLTKLAALPPAPAAAARVVWNPKTREAWLLASGLAPAPSGKGYEVWVIGKAAPAPAGVFQVDADGKAAFRLPVVAETSEVTTFAVTLESAAGTSAPSGPMVLAGAVS